MSNNSYKFACTDHKLPIFDTISENEFPILSYFYVNYNVYPSNCSIKQRASTSVCKDLEAEGFKHVWTYKRIDKNQENPVTLVYIKDKVVLRLNFISDRQMSSIRGIPTFYFDEDSFIESEDQDIVSMPTKIEIDVFYDSEQSCKDVCDIIKKHYIDETKKPKISLVVSSGGSLTVSPQEIKPEKDLDIELNYGADFVPVHEKIIERLNNDVSKGLVLLHGLPGTGKTSYIRHLCSKVNKEIIFIPPYMAENISGPDFIPFLLRHVNSILIIEDAERVVLERDSYESNKQSVANILNMTDGILSDCLSIQVVATFNTGREKIDKALLRKGRLIAEYKFDSLSVEDSNKLLKHLGKEYVTKVPMTLTEIYNLEEKLTVVEEKRSTIGFGNR